MAIAATHLTTSFGLTDTTFTTASVSPSANALVLVAISCRVASGSVQVPTLSGNGLTWTLVASINTSSGSGGHRLFRALGASPTSGAISITFAAEHATCRWSVVQFTGVDTSGTGGAGAIVQSATGGTTPGPATTATITLGEFSNSNNATFGGWLSGSASANTFTPGSGFTILGTSSGTNGSHVATEWKTTNDTTVDITQSDTAGSLIGVAVEIKDAQQASTSEEQWGAVVI